MTFFGLASLPTKAAHTRHHTCVIAMFLIRISHVIGDRHFAAAGDAVDVPTMPTMSV